MVAGIFFHHMTVKKMKFAWITAIYTIFIASKQESKMSVQKYIVETTQTKITTWATSADAAKRIVMKSENCPESAILSIEEE